MSAESRKKKLKRKEPKAPLKARELSPEYVEEKLIAFSGILKQVVGTSSKFSGIVDLGRIVYSEDEQRLLLGIGGDIRVNFYSTVSEVYSGKKKPDILHEEEYSVVARTLTHSEEDGPGWDEMELCTSTNPYKLVVRLLAVLFNNILHDTFIEFAKTEEYTSVYGALPPDDDLDAEDSEDALVGYIPPSDSFIEKCFKEDMASDSAEEDLGFIGDENPKTIINIHGVELEVRRVDGRADGSGLPSSMLLKRDGITARYIRTVMVDEHGNKVSEDQIPNQQQPHQHHQKGEGE